MIIGKKIKINPNRIIKWGVIFIMLVSISGVLGCGRSLYNQREKLALNLLNEKYNEDFVVYTIGESYGTLTNSTFTAICSPKDDLDIRFEAKVDKDGKGIRDGYIIRQICKKVENEISTVLDTSISSYTIRVTSPGSVTNITDTNASIEDYVNEDKNRKYNIKIIIDQEGLKDINSEELYGAFQEMFNNLPVMNGSLHLYFTDSSVLSDVRDYLSNHVDTEDSFYKLVEDSKVLDMMFTDNQLSFDLNKFVTEMNNK